MIALLCVYTALIFSFLVYLLYLRFFHLVRYNDAYTRFAVNLNFYLILVYVIAFVLSTWFTMVCYGAELAGLLVSSALHDTSLLDQPVHLTNYNLEQGNCDAQSIAECKDNPEQPDFTKTKE